MGRTPMQLNGFEDFELIGEGGFAKVYSARQVGFDRQVAVKVLEVGMDERQRMAFERELRAMGVVSQHPNIVTVYSADFTTGGAPAIVMELFRSGTTADMVRRDSEVAPATVLDIGVKMAAALQTAHDRGLLHRDIKPQNIFVSEFGEPALGDFGISAFTGDAEGPAGGFSVHYAAPEVIERRAADPACDVYSLGATLYTLLAGRRPYAEPGRKLSTRDVALKVLRQPPPRLQGVPEQLQAAIADAMARHAGDRPASAASFGALLQEVQAELGQSQTRFVASVDAPAPSNEARPGKREATTAPVRESRRGRSTESGRDEGRDRSRGRVLASIAAGVVAVVGLAALGFVATRNEPTEPAPSGETINNAVAGDDFFDTVPPPEGIALERTGDGDVEVTWSGTEGATYELQRVDEAATGAPPIVATAPPAILPDVGPDQAPCIVMRAIGANGRISSDTPPACLGQPSPSATP